jgi:chemotaxis protein MotB
MKSVKKGMIGLLAAMMAVTILSGCTNWKKKYETLNVEYQNAIGQLQREREQSGKLAADLAAMQKQQEAGQTPDTGFKVGTVSVNGSEGTITVTLPDMVLFDSGKADLKRSSSAELDQIISTLKARSEYAGKPIDIVGNTDSDPISKSNWKDNWQLSAERALTVLRYMTSHGIAPERIRAVGAGESKPVVPNSSAANKSRNRRVEIVIHMLK